MDFTTQASVQTASDSGFYSKVFFFFGLAVLSSAAGCYIGLNYLAEFFLANPATMYIMFALELVLVFTARMWSTKAPLSYLLFFAFAAITGVTLVPLIASILASTGSLNLVIKAFLATSLMFAGAAVFGATTKINLQGLSGFLITALIGMIVISVIGIFIPWGSTFEMIFSGFGVLLFSGYTMYDIQKLKYYHPGQYIDAALQLYLDIFNLFLFVLRLMLSISRD